MRSSVAYVLSHIDIQACFGCFYVPSLVVSQLRQLIGL
jgi:hypothetical protein